MTENKKASDMLWDAWREVAQSHFGFEDPGPIGEFKRKRAEKEIRRRTAEISEVQNDSKG